MPEAVMAETRFSPARKLGGFYYCVYEQGAFLASCLRQELPFACPFRPYSFVVLLRSCCFILFFLLAGQRQRQATADG